ncbi:MAG TPA: helicase C-terminal domain-containing protein, partial [Bacteroidia bacterium]|nr:helicase C-terminal domain-containing protein [Bacteroidia bacterium]
LAQYFIHDGGSTSKWRLKGHGVKRFFDFVSTWAIMLSKPSDIGFDDTGYVLPDLNMEEITIKTPHRNEGQLFNDKAVSATDFNQELRITLIDRIETAAKLVNDSEENWICWVKQNEESKELTKLIYGSVEVKGSDDPEVKKAALLDFAKDRFKCLVTKPKIAQYGLNYQNCHNQIFVALDFSFEGLYQSIRRSYRFGQKHPVNIYLITTDTMQNVLHAIKTKQEQFKQMQTLMTKKYV